MEPNIPVISLKHCTVEFNGQVILKDISFELQKGETIGVIGPSGQGKSTMIHTLLGLVPYTKGTVMVLNHNVSKQHRHTDGTLKMRMGMLFQKGALFSTLTALENIALPIRTHTNLENKDIQALALAKMRIVGLSDDDACKLPNELSGGMIKRVALARALALDPELLFLDEPTAGLDPISASAFNTLINALRKALGLSILMVTHDPLCLLHTCDRIAALVDHKIIALGTTKEIFYHPHPWLRSYFKASDVNIKL